MKKIKYYVPKDFFENNDEIADAITLTVYLNKPENTDYYVLEDNSLLQSRLQMAEKLTELNLIKTAKEYSEVINKGSL